MDKDERIAELERQNADLQHANNGYLKRARDAEGGERRAMEAMGKRLTEEIENARTLLPAEGPAAVLLVLRSIQRGIELRIAGLEKGAPRHD